MRAKKSFAPHRGQSSGVALVIVLAFIVLLTGLVVAFFSRAMTDRQVSNSSASLTKASQLAEGAADTLISNLQQEIAIGSATTTIVTGTISSTVYVPLSPSGMLPQISGTAVSGITSWSPNLLIRSGSGTANQYFFSGTNQSGATVTIPSGAIAVSSTTPSLNGRSVPPVRWNKHCLLSSTDSSMTPRPDTFVAPDWVLVTRSGTNPVQTSPTSPLNLTWSATNSSTVVGRYAYAIYHEGGLLDLNVAGYPLNSGTAYSSTNSDPVGFYKSALAFADLTQIPGISGSNASTLIKNLVGWRNYVSSGATGNLSSGYVIGTGSNSVYTSAILSNTTGFLSVSGSTLSNNQSDRMFSSRQELIHFFQTALNLSGTNLNALNYLTHFSRDINQPSFIPAVQTNASAPMVLAANLGGNSAIGGDKFINPSFPNTRVQAAFQRNDGSTANIGDPLVNRRFALNRLAWITYKGPSGGDASNGLAARTQSDPDIQALINAGIPYSYLLQGTASNIQNYFGLTWDNTNHRWIYDLHRGTSGTSRIIKLVGRPLGTGANATKYVQDSNREPDFFELLKAGITVGSLGKSAVSSGTAVSVVPNGYALSQNPANLRYNLDSSVDYHIIQLGANILSEVNPTSYATRIAYDDGSARGLLEFQGVTDLPYLSYVFNGVIRMRMPSPAPAARSAVDSSPHQYPAAQNVPVIETGSACMVQVPAVWNPYDPNGASAVLRPSQFRVVINSNDPISLANGNADLPMWIGAEAAGSTVAGSGAGAGNQGMSAPGAVYTVGRSGLGGGPSTLPTTAGTPVNDAVTFNDSNGTLYREPTLIFSTQVGGATRTAGNITGIDANPLPGENDGSTGPWAPLVLGTFPLAFANSSANTTTYFTGSPIIGLAAGNGDNRVYFTYRLQYKDSNNAWVTYDTKYGRTTHGLVGFQNNWNGGGSLSPCVIKGPDWYNAYTWATTMDPRTARFGLMLETFNGGRSRTSAAAPADVGWIFNSSGGSTGNVGVTYPIRQDNTRGFFCINLDGNNTPAGAPNNDRNFGMLTAAINNVDVPFPSYTAGWTAPVAPVNEGHGESDAWMCAPGLYAQNNPKAPFYDGNTIQPAYYADPDGVVRRGAGAYVLTGGTASGITPVGVPSASINGYTGKPTSLLTPGSLGSGTSSASFAQSQSRPLLLHRPFRTVAELGYVFRDLPWRNIDFSTPESGDAGLLDLFCLNDTSDPNGMVAGKVNLNTRQTPVLAAIVSGAYVDDPKLSNLTVGSLSPTLSGSVAKSLTARTSDTTNAAYGPLQSISDLVGRWNNAVACAPPTGVTYSPNASTWASNPTNSGKDLPLGSGFQDGQLSYTGFSGNASVSGSNSGKDLSAAFLPTTAGSLIESMAYVKRFREAPIRALGSVGQARVWNLLIDLVAQTGRYPTSATSLDKFIVEGEQHYWVHVAIDRLTGQVLDKQVEVVKE